MYTTDTQSTDGLDPYLKPTSETYDRLQWAYEHFNDTLFDDALPNCMITLQRKHRSYGYFSKQRFKSTQGQSCDEIALNPAFFQTQSVEDILATLVHEMVHLWQHHCGTPARGRYHNREWAEQMKCVGLQPTHNGFPDGQEVGDRMSHLVISGGRFEKACLQLKQLGFKIEWRDDPDAAGQTHAMSKRPSRAGRRIKYQCPHCDLKAWAKHEAQLICGIHHARMTPT
ncbi:MAG: SprT-like domain-containing protein [Pseudomonadota bacterium]